MSDDADSWRIEVSASANIVAAFEGALEPFCGAVSWFVTETGPGWRIEGYCDIKPDPKAVAGTLADTAAALGTEVPLAFIHRMVPRDWVAENLTIFPPVNIGRYFIYPTHYESEVPPGRVSICMNPGAAFGSGEHATTSGCLMALDWLARRRRFGSALDLGCGSGILSMAIAGTWRIPVVASDLDAKAVFVARDNIKRNRMTRMVRAVHGDGYLSPEINRRAPFDLIVSNILANPLCRMAADLDRHLDRRCGVAVLSGFLERDANRVLAAHRGLGLRLLRRFDIGGWRTLVVARRRS